MPFLGMFIGDKTIRQLKELFLEELAELFPVVMKNYIGGLQQENHLEDVLYHKLAAIPPERIERLVHELLEREWRMIKFLGAIAGLLIGLIQLGLLWLTTH